jgi:hypothetical protein
MGHITGDGLEWIRQGPITFLYTILGSHSDGYEEVYLLGYAAV